MCATKTFQGGHINYIKCIGQGTSWGTYLAQHKLSKQYFAVKKLHKKNIDVSKSSHCNMARLAQCRELMESASNPFVVRILGSGVTDTHLFMVTDVLYGGEMTNILKHAPLGIKHSQFYIANIVLALECLRKKNVVSRGVRPENIFVDSSGYLKLGGFGWAKKIREKTYTRITGMDYTSPECLVGHEHDYTADIWSLGALLYHLSVGSLPFTDTSHARRNRQDNSQEQIQMTYNLMRKGLVGFPLTLPVKQQNIIKLMLDPFADQRITHGEDDLKDIKKHPWYVGFDWKAMEDGLLDAPWVPRLKGPEDIQYFRDDLKPERAGLWGKDDAELSEWEPDFW